MSNLQSVLQKTIGLDTDLSGVKAIQNKAWTEQQENQNLLARQIAAQRAKMGALGIDPDSGSSAAVINGLTEETHLKNTQVADTARRQIKTNLNSQSKKNLKSLISGGAQIGAAMLA